MQFAAQCQLFVADLPAPDAEGNLSPITRDKATKLSTDDLAQALLPLWSPDGSTLVFTSTRSATDVRMKIVPVDASEPPRMIGDDEMSGFGWSSDGEAILAIDNLNDAEDSLLEVNIDSGAIDDFVPLPFPALLAAWSPDESEVAVIDRVAGAMWLLDSDGSSIRQALGNNFLPLRMAWRPVPINATAVLEALAAASLTP